MSAETHVIKTGDGRDLCVEVAGGRAERTILAHNGTPNSRHLFGPWIEDAKGRGVRLVSYDRPGYGGSSPQPGHRVADGAGDVEAIAGALEIERLAIWGLSGGGPYALACAALLPDLVTAVATVGSVAPWGVAGLDYFAGMGELNVEDIELYFSDPEAARRKAAQDRDELMVTTPDKLLEDWSTLLSGPDRAVLDPGVAQFFVDSCQDGLRQGADGWWDDGVSHMEPWGFELDSIQVPVKVWHGRHDRFVPVQQGEWLAAHIPGAQADISAQDGHLSIVINRVADIHDWLLSHS